MPRIKVEGLEAAANLTVLKQTDTDNNCPANQQRTPPAQLRKVGLCLVTPRENGCEKFCNSQREWSLIDSDH